MLILLYLFFFVNSSLPNDILRQDCKLTMPTEASDCNSITDNHVDKYYNIDLIYVKERMQNIRKLGKLY